MVGNPYFEIATPGTAVNKFLNPDDTLAATNLTGGVDPNVEPSDNDYPYFIDFEPKKRELYEAVNTVAEHLSGSAGRVSTEKGRTTAAGIETSFAGIGAKVEVGTSESTTRDASTERRETQGRTTQLSQMYQLFNGYHLGTNRAVFAIFPRPHVVSQQEYQQTDYNLINGQRQIEGIQDVFLVALMPRTIPGICVEARLDTAHRGAIYQFEVPNRFIITRRIVHGCAEFDGDVMVPVPPAIEPYAEPPPPIVGEGVLQASHRFRERKQPGEFAAQGMKARIETADNLNLEQVELRQHALSFAASSSYEPIETHDSETFKAIAAEVLSQSQITLEQLVTFEYITNDHKSALEERGITTAGGVFRGKTEDPIVAEVQQLLWFSIRQAIDTGGGGGLG